MTAIGTSQSGSEPALKPLSKSGFISAGIIGSVAEPTSAPITTRIRPPTLLLKYGAMRFRRCLSAGARAGLGAGVVSVIGLRTIGVGSRPGRRRKPCLQSASFHPSPQPPRVPDPRPSTVATTPPSSARVSVYAIAHNEAEKIADALASLQWADEIVLADSHSTDRTVEVAAALGARVVQIYFEGFGALRNRATQACTGDWMFSLDADERCTPAVRDEVLALIGSDSALDVCQVPRRNYFMGRWVRHSGCYPNYRQPQIFRRASMRHTLEPVHEGYELLTAKPFGQLVNAIWQFPFRNLDEVVRKLNRYSTLGAEKVQPEQSFYRYAKRVELDAGWTFPKHEPVARPGKPVRIPKSDESH